MSNKTIFEHNRRTEEESLIQRQFKAREICQMKCLCRQNKHNNSMRKESSTQRLFKTREKLFDHSIIAEAM